jgi:hypothetical protein
MAIADLVITLAKHEVEFIVVGGMAAILRGTPVNTFDLDIHVRAKRGKHRAIVERPR